MIKIERNYNAKSLFTNDQANTWDREREKTFTVKLFGVTIFSRKELLNIDYEGIGKSGMGFKK